MKISKILFQLSLALGLLLLFVGIIMKFSNVESKGWYFTKTGNLINGTLDANGTLILSVIMLSFALWNRKTYKQERQQTERSRNIENNENRLRK